MPRPTRFTLEEIARVIGEAGIDESGRQEIARKLYEVMAGKRGRIGRPPENDDEAILAVARLVHKGNNAHAAANQVTAYLPESQRVAARQRLYRKFKKDSTFWLSEARLTPIQEEIERLRELIGPSADSLDYGQFIRHLIKKDS